MYDVKATTVFFLQFQIKTYSNCKFTNEFYDFIKPLNC